MPIYNAALIKVHGLKAGFRCHCLELLHLAVRAPKPIINIQ